MILAASGIASSIPTLLPAVIAGGLIYLNYQFYGKMPAIMAIILLLLAGMALQSIPALNNPVQNFYANLGTSVAHHMGG